MCPRVISKTYGKHFGRTTWVVCQIDDVLVFGATHKEHDNRLFAVIRRLESAGVTLNLKKCEFAKDKVRFLGHQVSKAGVQPDPQKIAAITSMKPPSNITALCQFLGMINQCGKLSLNLAELTKPLRALLAKNCKWQWSQAQDDAYAAVKEEILKPTTLALYNPEADNKISTDASSFGPVLLQKEGQMWQPVTFASCAMTDTECLQIEKEALATTCGKKIIIETDHKPLVSLFSKKQLEILLPEFFIFI